MGEAVGVADGVLITIGEDADVVVELVEVVVSLDEALLVVLGTGEDTDIGVDGELDCSPVLVGIGCGSVLPRA